jgi:hypothetical protein
MKKYAHFYVFAVLLFSLLVGCGPEKLSKEEAKAKLASHPATISRSISRNLRITHSRGSELTPEERMKATLHKLEAAGYVSIRKTSVGAGEESYEVTPTETLTPFLMAEDADSFILKLADITLSEVVAVKQNGDRAEVIYVNRITPVLPPPLSEILPLGDIAGISKGSAYFLWRDGQWR